MRRYEGLTRNQLIEELAKYDDHFEAIVSKEVRARCGYFEESLDKFFDNLARALKGEEVKSWEISSPIGNCAEYAIKGGYLSDVSLFMQEKGVPQYTTAISNDWPQKYFNFDRDGIGDKIVSKVNKFWSRG